MLCIISVAIWGGIFLLTYVYMKLLFPVLGGKKSRNWKQKHGIVPFFSVRTNAEYHDYFEMVNNVTCKSPDNLPI